MSIIKADFLFLIVLFNCLGFNTGYAAKPAAVPLSALRHYIAKGDVAAFNTVKGAIPNIEYRQLEELHRLANQTKYKVDILSQVSQENVWTQFKEIIEQMNAAAQEAVQKEKESNMKCSRGLIDYAKQYVRQEQSKSGIAVEKKKALGFIEGMELIALDANFEQIMCEAEKDPSKMQAYFLQAKQSTDSIYGVLDAEYKKYVRVPFYDEAWAMHGFKIVKKSEKEQSESICTLQ